MISGLKCENISDLVGKKFSDVNNFICKNVSLRNLSIFTNENEINDCDDLMDKFEQDEINFLCLIFRLKYIYNVIFYDFV